MGNVKINISRIRHYTDDTRQIGVHLGAHDSTSPPCSQQDWGTVVLAAQGAQLAVFRAVLCAVFGVPWVDGLPDREPDGTLVLLRLMETLSTL